jgi:hypothetical protein
MIIARCLFFIAFIFIENISLKAEGFDIPTYNVEKICEEQSRLMNGGSFLINACLRQEQNSYNHIKSDWESFDVKTKSHCADMAKTIIPSYFMLYACLQQEKKSKQEIENFKFKR